MIVWIDRKVQRTRHQSILACSYQKLSPKHQFVAVPLPCCPPPGLIADRLWIIKDFEGQVLRMHWARARSARSGFRDSDLPAPTSKISWRSYETFPYETSNKTQDLPDRNDHPFRFDPVSVGLDLVQR